MEDYDPLTRLIYYDWDKSVSILWTLSNASSWVKMFNFRLKFHCSLFPWVRLKIKPAMVQMMAWRRTGDKPLFEPIMAKFFLRCCVIRPLWVNIKLSKVKKCVTQNEPRLFLFSYISSYLILSYLVVFGVGNLVFVCLEIHTLFYSDEECRPPGLFYPRWFQLVFLLVQTFFLFKHTNVSTPWWSHQMETFSALLAFVRVIHRWPVNSSHKGQWRGALMFSLICAWTETGANNGDAADFRRYRVYFDVIVMQEGYPDRKVHGACMGPTWGRQDPGGPHVGPMNLAIRVLLYGIYVWNASQFQISRNLVWA